MDFSNNSLGNDNDDPGYVIEDPLGFPDDGPVDDDMDSHEIILINNFNAAAAAAAQLVFIPEPNINTAPPATVVAGPPHRAAAAGVPPFDQGFFQQEDPYMTVTVTMQQPLLAPTKHYEVSPSHGNYGHGQVGLTQRMAQDRLQDPPPPPPFALAHGNPITAPTNTGTATAPPPRESLPQSNYNIPHAVSPAPRRAGRPRRRRSPPATSSTTRYSQTLIISPGQDNIDKDNISVLDVSPLTVAIPPPSGPGGVIKNPNPNVSTHTARLSQLSPNMLSNLGKIPAASAAPENTKAFVMNRDGGAAGSKAVMFINGPDADPQYSSASGRKRQCNKRAREDEGVEAVKYTCPKCNEATPSMAVFAEHVLVHFREDQDQERRRQQEEETRRQQEEWGKNLLLLGNSPPEHHRVPPVTARPRPPYGSLYVNGVRQADRSFPVSGAEEGAAVVVHPPSNNDNDDNGKGVLEMEVDGNSRGDDSDDDIIIIK